MVEFKNGKVLIENQEFSNPQIIGELLIAKAKEIDENIKVCDPKD